MNRVFLFGLVVLAALLVAPNASACEDCSSYYDYQNLHWCSICIPTHCGYFQCDIRQASWGTDYCGGDDAGCFDMTGYRTGGCGPEQQGYVGPKLEDRWRLKAVRASGGLAPLDART